MKKLFTIVLMLIAGLTVCAQGTWSTGTIEADDLKDEKGGVFYRYDLEGIGSLILRDWEGWEFKIITESGQFDSFEMNDGMSHGIFYTFGYYTDDNKLEFKFKDDRLEVDHNNKQSAWINKQWTHYFYNPKIRNYHPIHD